MRKKVWMILASLFLIGCLGLTVVMLAEEIIAVKKAVYYMFNPVPVPGETDHLYSLKKVETTGEEWFADRPLIQHAGGGIDGNYYTNSREAVMESLSEGKLFIEMDLIYTSDGHLVCAHTWPDVYMEDYCPTLDEFTSTKIQGKYTPLTAQDLIAIMRDHPQMYLITDVKEPERILSVFTDLVEMAQGDPSVLDRFIVQLYTGREKSDIQAIYPFEDDRFVFTTYMWGHWQHEVAAICNEENVSVITVPYGEMSDEDAAMMKELGFTVYEFTVNRADYAKASRARGISGFYTDFLSDEDLQ